MSRVVPHLPYHPVVLQPHEVVVLDLSQPWPDGAAGPLWSIGRYDEERVVYTQALFAGRRTVHMGVDLGGPAGVAVHAFWAGTVLHAGVNPADGDYGPTLVTRHELQDIVLYALWGHLSRASLSLSPVSRAFDRGAVLGWLGVPTENGGWAPHLHFQLAWDAPHTHDLPGVVAPEERVAARERYPDPRQVLGPIYP